MTWLVERERGSDCHGPQQLEKVEMVSSESNSTNIETNDTFTL